MASQVTSIDECVKFLTYEILLQAAKLSLEKDKSLNFDYYIPSIEQKCKVVKTPQEDKVLFKSQDEYTSPIIKLLSPCSKGDILFCETQNSLYIVHNNMLKN